MMNTTPQLVVVLFMVISTTLAAKGPCPKVSRADYDDWKKLEGDWWVPFRVPNPSDPAYKCVKSTWKLKEDGLTMEAKDKMVKE